MTKGVRYLVHLMARPVRRARRERTLVIQPYRGFGSPARVFLIGRVLRQPRTLPGLDPFARDLLDVARRLFRRGVAAEPVVARIDHVLGSTTTDPDGYFHFELPIDPRRVGRHGWVDVTLQLANDPTVTVTARVLVHPTATRCLVVSDIDDTVVETGVANRLVMMWRLFGMGARARTAVPGFAPLLRALNRGPGGCERNPLLFVSRAPWTIYETLDAFFRLQGLPRDCALFLREWGMRWYRPVARRDREHKLALIRRLLTVAPDPPVVLIGDSGQQDAEVYAAVVEEFPGRVVAVLIRDLATSPSREQAIRRLAADLERSGARLVLASSTVPMASALADLGLIQRAAVAQVRSAID